MNGRSAEQNSHNEALSAVQARITLACLQAARPRQSVHLLAVSKTFPAQDVMAFAQLGQLAFGENYLQEALDKQAQCRLLSPELASRLEWHFIGPLQSNKTRPVAEHFEWVHSVDRDKIARRLIEQRPEGLPTLNVCLQVNISGEASKSGMPAEEVAAQALAVAAMMAEAGRSRPKAPCALRGLMCIPEPATDESGQRKPFAAMQQLHLAVKQELRARYPDRAKAFDTLSMGMSADLQAAVLEGANIVRVGTALFGAR